MDSEGFDRLARALHGEASRRWTMRAGVALLSALIAPVAATEIEAKKKKKKKKKSPPSPPPPPPPPPPVAPKTCTADRPVTCGDGCCLSDFPLCCDSVSNPIGKSCNPSGNGFHCCAVELGGDACGGSTPQCCPQFLGRGGSICAPADFTCCTTAQGGGACGGEFPQCCGITTQSPFGLCAAATDTCCGSNNGGTSCPAGKVCCPNIFSDPKQQGCCDSVADCCAADNQCSAPTPNCVDGCCTA